MIGHLKGKLISKNPPEILLEVGGIGYELLCPMSTFYQFDSDQKIFCYIHISALRMTHIPYLVYY